MIILGLENLKNSSTFTPNHKLATINYLVFNKSVTSNVMLHHMGEQKNYSNATYKNFHINENCIKELNLVVPNIAAIIESSMPKLIQYCKTQIVELSNGNTPEVTESAIKSAFTTVSNIVAVEKTGHGEYVVIELRGRYPFFDAEHGTGLKIQNGKLVNIGQAGSFY